MKPKAYPSCLPSFTTVQCRAIGYVPVVCVHPNCAIARTPQSCFTLACLSQNSCKRWACKSCVRLEFGDSVTSIVLNCIFNGAQTDAGNGPEMADKGPFGYRSQCAIISPVSAGTVVGTTPRPEFSISDQERLQLANNEPKCSCSSYFPICLLGVSLEALLPCCRQKNNSKRDRVA